MSYEIFCMLHALLKGHIVISLIEFIGQGGKILLSGQILDAGLVIEQGRLLGTKAVTLSSVCGKARVLAVRAVIDRGEIIGGIAVGGQQRLLFGSHLLDVLLKGERGGLLTGEAGPQQGHALGRDLFIQCPIFRNMQINLLPALIELAPVEVLFLCIAQQDAVVLFSGECQLLLLLICLSCSAALSPAPQSHNPAGGTD